ncbi:YjzD family protein [Bacillus sp. EAC]|uniref:YjzD family protein n=1 Tax=Bacillus sp. EAC TaxID=1978338 RepID=UPI000B440986|nr:YjzD family protein [Bacillus sp. EAC]
MRVVMAFFWCFILSHMGAYVLSSMTGGEYNFTSASLMAIAFTAIIMILSEAVIPNDPAPKHH